MLTIANVEMAKAWDGAEGDDWTDYAERYDRAGNRHWRAFLDRAFVADHDVVLDIGCGTGRPTRDAARVASSGAAHGIDLSSRMIQRAREVSAAEGLVNVRFEQGDAQVYPFPEGRFDVAISNFGGMFFADPVAAFGNIGRALRPGGRLAMLAWRELDSNEWLLELRAALAVGRTLPAPPTGAPGPFGLADADHVRSVLAAGGFRDIALDEVGEPVDFGTDADDAFAFVRTFGIVRGLTQDLDDTTRATALEGVRAMLVRHETHEGVLLGTSAWLITARRP